MSEEFVNIEEARRRLGVSRGKIADLIRRGILTTHPNLLDERSKLIKVSDLEKILASGAVPRKKAEGGDEDESEVLGLANLG